jgi:transposase
VFAESVDEEQIIARVAAVDIGKAELVCCVRMPAPSGSKRRVQEVTTHSTMTRSLAELANRLVDLRVDRVVMEATSDYWKPVFYLFEAHGLDPWLVNARDVRHLPGRPKTDVLDAVWLCKVAERQMLRPSFVPPRPIRVLRDLTRYRIDLVAARTAEKSRVEKLLEDACIKLSVVASDIFGVSGRAMLAALIAGERDPKVLADLARSRMRAKIKLLEEAFAGLPAGGFDDHHRFLLERMLGRVDAIDADIAVLDAQIEVHLTPFDQAVQRLDEIPGIGPVAAAIVIAEIGLDMTRFPTAGHLCSWAKFSPGLKSSAGKNKGSGSTGHGDRYLARVLGEAAVMAGRSDTFLGDRYRRIARRRGKKKAVVAVGRSMLVIIWHLLADPDTRFHDLGADHFARNVNTEARKRSHIRQLEALGYRVTLESAACPKALPDSRLRRELARVGSPFIFGLDASGQRRMANVLAKVVPGTAGNCEVRQALPHS